MVAREQSRIHLVFDHQVSDRILTALHFTCREGWLGTYAIVAVIYNLGTIGHVKLHLE